MAMSKQTMASALITGARSTLTCLRLMPLKMRKRLNMMASFQYTSQRERTKSRRSRGVCVRHVARLAACPHMTGNDNTSEHVWHSFPNFLYQGRHEKSML